MPHFGQGFSKIASKPHSSVLFPEHLLIVAPFSVVADLQRLERCLRYIRDDAMVCFFFVSDQEVLWFHKKGSI